MLSQYLKNHILRGAAAVVMAVCAAVSLPSCSDDLDLPGGNTDPVAGYINLTLKCTDNVSRAVEEPGVDDLNENRIFSVTLCMSPYAGDRTPEDEPLYFNTFTNLDANDQVVLRIPLDSEMVTRLFGESGNNKCHVFAAVNVAAPDARTEADLRNAVVNSTFATNKTQRLFTMDGDGIIEYTQQGNYAVGDIDVQRSASKITLALDVDDEVEEVVNGETLTWVPNLAGMYVILQQGVQTSTLDPAPTPDMDEKVYFNSSADLTYSFKTVTRPEDDKYARYDSEIDVPFYTYPNKWTDNLDEDHATFMLLAVPWSSDGKKSWRTCYYHVPIIPNGHFELTRNISYHVFLHVGVLGSFVPDEPLEVEGDYFVANWGEKDIDVDIKDYRYLVVDQNDYIVNNEPSITIPFYTSHETVVTNVKMTFYRYNFSDQGSEFAINVSPEQNTLTAEKNNGKAIYSCEFRNGDNVLYLEHLLNIFVPHRTNGNIVLLTRNADGTRSNTDIPSAIQAMLNTIAYYTRSDEDEYSRVEFEVTVQHKDVFDGTSGINKDLYKETVTITQYPGMYITAVQNFCGNLASISSGQEWVANAIYGNTIVNGRTEDLPSTLRILPTPNNNWGLDRKLAFCERMWETSIGLGAPTKDFLNWNPNLYLVTITQLSQELGAKYKIDDPRSYNINNWLDNDGSPADYTVDGGTTTQFLTQYWYFQVGNNNKGPESSASFETLFQGHRNPLNFQVDVNKGSWNEYIVNGWVTAPSLDSDKKQRKLQYYYPTREAEDNTWTIAPKFRICSSYAGSRSVMTRSMSRRRAAAYQELGYAAGRWRLPTFGEVEYIMTLAAQEKIPRLFGRKDLNTWTYWCAQGAVEVPPGNASDQTIKITTNPSQGASEVADEGNLLTGNYFRARTRFVYDEWYWGSGTLDRAPGDPSETSLLYTFTWGDQVKTSPESNTGSN